MGHECARTRARVINLAHGAQTSSQLLLQIQTTPPLHSTYSVVQIGINDLHPLGVLEPYEQEIIDTLRANVVAIRDALLARSDRVVLTTIFPPGPVPWTRQFAWDPQTPSTIDEINGVIKDAGNVPRVMVLDAHALLRDDRQLLDARYAEPDFFLHVNRVGYARLNSELARLLAPAGR